VHRGLVPPATATHHVVPPLRLPGHSPAMPGDRGDCRLTFRVLPAHGGEPTPVFRVYPDGNAGNPAQAVRSGPTEPTVRIRSSRSAGRTPGVTVADLANADANNGSGYVWTRLEQDADGWRCDQPAQTMVDNAGQP
jgi:hypothetical protein